jgi:hypothetical protein
VNYRRCTYGQLMHGQQLGEQFVQSTEPEVKVLRYAAPKKENRAHGSYKQKLGPLAKLSTRTKN